MRVLVCGGRDYDNFFHLSDYLDSLHKDTPITCIINGGAKGADSLSAKWADTNQINYTTIPAKWGKYGKSAGYKRNVEMLDEKPDLVVAFKGGKGTAMMVDIAAKAGVKVDKVEDNELLQEEPYTQTEEGEG